MGPTRYRPDATAFLQDNVGNGDPEGIICCYLTTGVLYSMQLFVYYLPELLRQACTVDDDSLRLPVVVLIVELRQDAPRTKIGFR